MKTNERTKKNRCQKWSNRLITKRITYRYNHIRLIIKIDIRKWSIFLEYIKRLSFLNLLIWQKTKLFWKKLKLLKLAKNKINFPRLQIINVQDLGLRIQIEKYKHQHTDKHTHTHRMYKSLNSCCCFLLLFFFFTNHHLIKDVFKIFVRVCVCG